MCGYVLFLFADKWSSVDLLFYGDKIPEEESALLISNHLGAEFVHFFQLAYRAKMIHALRFVQKDALKWVPINWTCYLHEHVFVKRGTASSRKESTRQMRDALCSFGEDRVPVWMVIFPEGTWVAGPGEQNLVDRSQAFAKKSNLPVYRNVLTPRTAGFCAAVDGAAVSVAASEDSLAALCELLALSAHLSAIRSCSHDVCVQTMSLSRTRTTRLFSARKCRHQSSTL
jgi:lysophosphatidic acid acyltransferase/lysophosphatidylinositol acyltransferase